MPKCNQCSCKWTWKHTFLQVVTFKKKLKCHSCKETQYLTRGAAHRIGMYAMYPFILWFVLTLIHTPFKYELYFELISYILLLLIIPFFYELSNEEELMW
ncbi:hypothetical protein SFC65_24080 [Priestia filamentosa]|uniref:TIGR04104 family putative zinc finger protein n=1 Tax=Priestia filamentosa TaxID=1402861 RepID=UPI003981A9D1